MNCGGHTAQSCSYCPQGNGHYWCNGDCQWNWQTNTCEELSSQRKTIKIFHASNNEIEYMTQINHTLTYQIYLIVR